ncbi:ATP-binding protein [Streptomyces sp. NPDC006967]|uniref:ATP-binding protein n=1 Tax=Streptomyces sp. NPDC006967 TaxID=3156906 RepID=UPI0033F0CE64
MPAAGCNFQLACCEPSLTDGKSVRTVPAARPSAVRSRPVDPRPRGDGTPRATADERPTQMARPPLSRPLHHIGNGLPPRPPGGGQAAPLPQPDGLGRPASGLRPVTETRAFDLPAAPAAVRSARGGVRELLTARGVGDEVRDNAVIVTSEIVTNALTHSAGDRFVCRLHLTAALIRVEVEDQALGRGPPVLRRPGPDAQNGRGLLLVDALSSAWAVTGCPGRPGRMVWAELRRETGPSPLAPPRGE